MNLTCIKCRMSYDVEIESLQKTAYQFNILQVPGVRHLAFDQFKYNAAQS
jgi:hypothetical protein